MKEKRDAISIFFRQVRFCRICFNYVSFYIFISLVILQPTDGAKLYEDSSKHHSIVENGMLEPMSFNSDHRMPSKPLLLSPLATSCTKNRKDAPGPCNLQLQNGNVNEVNVLLHQVTKSSLEKSNTAPNPTALPQKFKPYAEEFIKKTVKEARPIEQTYKENQQKYKKEHETKNEQKIKRENYVKVEERKKEHSRKQRVEESKKDDLKNSRRAEYTAKKPKLNLFKPPMVTGKTTWPVCKFLPGYFYVQQYSVLVRTTVDMRPLLANGEGISFYERKGAETLGDFTVTDPRDAVTLTLNDPYEGPTKKLKACKMDNTPITLEGYTPLQGVVAVLAGSSVIRTSRCLLGTIGIGDTIHIGAVQEFTVKNPITCEALTLDRPWPANAGLKGDTPVSPDQIRWMYGGGIIKYSTGIDKLTNGKLQYDNNAGGQDININTTYGKNIDTNAYRREGSLWVEYDCDNLAKDLCRAAFVESSETLKAGRNKFVVDIFKDREKCCDTQDVRSCSPGTCRDNLLPIAHIHVEVHGKHVFYKIDDHESGKTLRRRRMLLNSREGELLS